MTAWQRVRATLAQSGPLTQQQIEAITGLPHGTVLTGLYRLRRFGVLQVESIPSKRGRPFRRYALVKAA
jgi:predicted ArsR family transcriptional regulator